VVVSLFISLLFLIALHWKKNEEGSTGEGNLHHHLILRLSQKKSQFNFHIEITSFFHRGRVQYSKDSIKMRGTSAPNSPKKPNLNYFRSSSNNIRVAGLTWVCMLILLLNLQLVLSAPSLKLFGINGSSSSKGNKGGSSSSSVERKNGNSSSSGESQEYSRHLRKILKEEKVSVLLEPYRF
jgi:hypothetical protein